MHRLQGVSLHKIATLQQPAHQQQLAQGRAQQQMVQGRPQQLLRQQQRRPWGSRCLLLGVSTQRSTPKPPQQPQPQQQH
jgi:hypothetical protein